VGFEPYVTVNVEGLWTVPFGDVTVTNPLVAPAGTVVVIWESESTLNAASVPANCTWVTPVKPDPVMTT
jgi:hypothetical protein